jgi:hypothetical protein
MKTLLAAFVAAIQVLSPSTRGTGALIAVLFTDEEGPAVTAPCESERSGRGEKLDYCVVGSRPARRD